MTRTTSATMEEEGPSDQIDTVFRVGNVVAATGIIDYGMSEEEVQNPASADPLIIDQVEQLASRLIEQISDAQKRDTPGLSLKSLVLWAEEVDTGFSSEGYRLIEGETIPYYNGYDDDLGLFLLPEVMSVYEVTQGLGSPASDPFDPYFASRLFAFVDDAGAFGMLNAIPDLLPPGFEVVHLSFGRLRQKLKA